MKVAILRRIENAEKKTKLQNKLVSLVIAYKADADRYKIIETYEKKLNTGYPFRERYEDKLEDIIIPGTYNNVIMLDEMERGEDAGGLFSVTAAEVRRRAKLKRGTPFSFGLEEPEKITEDLKKEFNIIFLL